MYVKMVSLCSKVSKGVGYMDTQYICTSESESEVHMYSMYCILLENTLVAYSLLGDPFTTCLLPHFAPFVSSLFSSSQHIQIC